MWPIFRLPCFVMSMCAARQRELEAAAPAATPFSQAAWACVPGGVCLGPWHAGALLGAWLCVIVIGVAEPLVFGILRGAIGSSITQPGQAHHTTARTN